MNPVVNTLEQNLLPQFRQLAEYLSADFPNLKVNVTSFSGGSLTNNPHHGIAVECLFTDAPHDQADHVALVVLVDRLNGHPRINADVCWGHPSGYIEAEFSSDLLEVSDEVLAKMSEDMPRLYESLIEAVKRRKPNS